MIRATAGYLVSKEVFLSRFVLLIDIISKLYTGFTNSE